MHAYGAHDDHRGDGKVEGNGAARWHQQHERQALGRSEFEGKSDDERDYSYDDWDDGKGYGGGWLGRS